MSKYAVRLATMQQVRDHYDSVKPIRGTTTRPMGFRGRKWEEIRKVDDNTFHVGMNMWGVTNFVPLVIWREVGGKTEVTISNGLGEGAHMSVYGFLDAFLPLGMRLIVKNGKQFVQRESYGFLNEGTGDYLPKGTYDRATSKEVAKPITYSRPTATCKPWVLTSKPYTLPRKVVDKERKAQYKQGISEFVEWAWTMVPIIGGGYRTTWGNHYERIRGFTEQGGTGFMQILVDPSNEQRLDILCAFVQEAHDNAPAHWDRNLRRHISKDPLVDPKKFRAKLNAYINKNGHFTHTAK